MKQLLERKHGARTIVFALLLTMLAWLASVNVGVVRAAEDDAKSPATGVKNTEGTKPMIPSTSSTNPTVGTTAPMEPTGNNPTSPTQTNPGDVTNENTQKISVTGGYLLFDKTTGTITGYEGEITEAAIPETFDGVKVNEIRWSAFRNCGSLTSVTIPESVTTIGGSAFADCSSLTNIIISEGVTTIGGNAFDGCSSLVNVTIPGSVTWIQSGVFDRCGSLAGITVDKSNNQYSDQQGVLFNKDKSELVEYPAGKRETSYEVPVGVTTIGERAFCGCDNLTSVKMPNGVEKIGSQAFWRSGLTNVTIPASVTSIKHEIFLGCVNLMSINVDAANPKFSSLDGVLCDKGGTKIIEYPAGRTDTGYVIPEGVSTIGGRAFYNSNLASITLPNSLTTIEIQAFSNCSNLAEIKVGEENFNFSTDGRALFNKGKVGMTLVQYFKKNEEKNYTIPEGVTTVVEGAFFGGFPYLTEIEIPESVMCIDRYAFGSLGNLTIKGYSGSYAHYYAQDNSVSFVSLGNATNPLNRMAYAINGGNLYFYKATGTIVEADDTIRDATIPEMIEGVKVTSVADRAFSNCYSLTNVTIPNSVTSIGERAFSGYGNLERVIIPASVTDIGEKAFGYHRGGDDFELTKNPDFKIYGYSNDSAAAKYAKDNGFEYAIVGSEDAKPGNDNQGGNNNQGGNSNNQIDKNVEDKPATVTTKTTAKIGSTVNDKKSNGSYVVTQTKNGGGTVAYKKPVNKKKSSVTIPATVRIEGKTYKVTTVEKNAFKGNKNLKSVKIGSNVEKIGANAFNKCTKLKTVKLPSKVRTIQKGAFAGCKNLKNITIQTKKLTKKTVGPGAFKGVNGKATVKVPKGKAKAYQKLLRSKGLSKKAKVK